MHCQLVSSERTLFDGDAVMVVARSRQGEFAIMAHHAPLLAVLDASLLRVKTHQGEAAFAVRGGLLRVLENTVSVLADAAVPGAEVDLANVEAGIAEAERALPEAKEKEDILRQLAYLRAQRRAKERHA